MKLYIQIIVSKSAIPVEKPKEKVSEQAPVEDVKPTLPPSPVVQEISKSEDLTKKQPKKAKGKKQSTDVPEQAEPMDVTPLPSVEAKSVEKPAEQSKPSVPVPVEAIAVADSPVKLLAEVPAVDTAGSEAAADKGSKSKKGKGKKNKKE